jgi:hypothetical protein
VSAAAEATNGLGVGFLFWQWPQAAKQATQRREENGAEAAAQATGIEEARSGEGPGQGEDWPLAYTTL